MSTPAPRASDTGTPEEARRERRSPLTDNRVMMTAVASFTLSNLLIELLGGAVSASAVGRLLQGPLAIVGYVLAPLLALVWLVGHGIRVAPRVREWIRRLLARLRRGQRPPPGEEVRPVPGLAEEAAYWVDRLDDEAASEAASWFAAEERSLRRLLDEHARADGPPSDQVADDLAAIAESLDTWYVRGRRLDDLRDVNESLRQVASRAGRPDLEQLAALRLAAAHRLRGDLGAARAELQHAEGIADRSQRRRYAAALEARRHHEWALIHLAEAERRTEDRRAAADELENAARFLRDGWARLPRADISGEITTLVNLAAVALHQERVEPTTGLPTLREPDRRRPFRVSDHLGMAEALARAERDLAGLAQAIELRGVAAWLDDQHRLAAERWRDAHDRYAELGLADGQARCLQHLGSAMLAVPEVAGLLRDNQWVALDVRTVAGKAKELLERSNDLRAGLPHVGTGIADTYLKEAEEVLSGRPPVDRPRPTDSARDRLQEAAARVQRWWKSFR